MEGGISNLMNHLETKHRVEYNKTVPSETRKKKQTTLSPFQANKYSPDHANMITKLIAEFVSRDWLMEKVSNSCLTIWNLDTRCLLGHMLLQLYSNEFKGALVSKDVAITIDLWTTRAI